MRSGKRDVDKAKHYRNYGQYVAHQKEKTLSQERIHKEKQSFKTKVERFTKMYKHWFAVGDFWPGSAVCAGARAGAEVAALRGLSIEAIGYDLVAFEPYTVYGDIHNMPCDEDSCDFAFTNVFDHSLYPDKFAEELERIVIPGGHILMQLPIGRSSDKYRVYSFGSLEEITSLFRGRLVASRSIPRRGSINTEALIVCDS